MDKSVTADRSLSFNETSLHVSDDEYKTKHNCTKTSLASESDECVIFQQLDIFSQGFPLMEEIRRQGKLCDVTLKVGVYLLHISFFKMI